MCLAEETNDYLQNMLLLPVTHIDDSLTGKFSMAPAILMMMRQEHHYTTDGNTITAEHTIHQTNATSSRTSTHSVHRYAESDGKRHTRSGKTGQLGECSRVHPESIALLISSILSVLLSLLLVFPPTIFPFHINQFLQLFKYIFNDFLIPIIFHFYFYIFLLFSFFFNFK